MKDVVEFRMECGHKNTAIMDKITLVMFCGNAYCLANRKVVAIETREWFFKCGGCRYGRYTGQNKEEAEMRLNWHVNHSNHANGEVWYRRVPEKSEFVKALFGRRVRNTISPPVKIFADEPKLAPRFITNVPLPGEDIPF